jgi:hypothetical protein
LSDHATLGDDVVSLQELCDSIKLAHSERKRGRLYFYYAAPKNGTMDFAYLVFDGSDTCLVHSSKFNQDSLVAELTGKDVVKINFMPIPLSKVEPSDFRLSVNELLELLSQVAQNKRVSPTKSVQEEPGLELIKQKGAEQLPAMENPAKVVMEITEILQTFYGGGAVGQVQKLVKKFPPESKPIHFLDGCRDMLDAMVGPKKSMALLQKFYDSAMKH